jgi:hypothetical protein
MRADGYFFLRLVLLNAVFREPYQQRYDPSSDCTSKSLNDRVFNKGGFAEGTARGDHCCSDRLQEVPAHAAPDCAGDRMAEQSKVVLLRDDCDRMRPENACNHLNGEI